MIKILRQQPLPKKETYLAAEYNELIQQVLKLKRIDYTTGLGDCIETDLNPAPVRKALPYRLIVRQISERVYRIWIPV